MKNFKALQIFPVKDLVLTLMVQNNFLRMALVRAGKTSSLAAVESCPPETATLDRLERVKFLLERAGPRLKACVLILGREEVILKNFKFEVEPPRALESEVQEKLLQLIPVDPHEVVSDYRSLAHSQERGEMSLVAGHRRIVDEKMKWLGEIPLVPDYVTFSSEAIFLACREKKFRYAGPSGVFLIDIDEAHSEILFAHQNEFIFSKKLDLGKEAYESDDPAIYSKLFHELDLLLQDSPDKLKTLTKRIVLSGAIPKGERLFLKLKEYFGLDPVRLDLEGQESVDFSVTALFGAAHAGGESRSFNLLPVEMKSRKKREEKIKAANRLVRMGCGVLLFLLFGSFSHWGAGRFLLGSMESRINRLKPRTTLLEETALALRLKKEEEKYRWLVLETLAQLHLQAPREVRLKKVTYEPKSGMVIRGQAETAAQVTDFFNQIRRLPRTEGWNLDHSRRIQSAHPVFGFQIRFHLEGDAQRGR